MPKGQRARKGLCSGRHPLKVPRVHGRIPVQRGQGGEGAHPMGNFGDGGDVGLSRRVIVGEGVVIPGGEP